MKQLVTTFAVLILCTIASAQSVAYSDPSGWTTKGDHWINKKTAKQLNKHGETTAFAFNQNLYDLRSFNQRLAEMRQDVSTEFAQCNDVTRLASLAVVVHIEDGPFVVAGHSGLQSGVANYSGDLQVVWWHLASFGPQTAAALARGELRNWFWWRLHGQPKEMWGILACP